MHTQRCEHTHTHTHKQGFASNKSMLAFCTCLKQMAQVIWLEVLKHLCLKAQGIIFFPPGFESFSVLGLACNKAIQVLGCIYCPAVSLLAGSKAIQVLGRLNRPLSGKTPSCIRVIDFANSASDICAAFEAHMGVITHSTVASNVDKQEVRLAHTRGTRVRVRFRAREFRGGQGPVAGRSGWRCYVFSHVSMNPAANVLYYDACLSHLPAPFSIFCV